MIPQPIPLLDPNSPLPGHAPAHAADSQALDPQALDIIFIGPDGRIANIAANTVPYSLDSVASKGPGRVADDRSRFCGRFSTLWGTYDVVDLFGEQSRQHDTAARFHAAAASTEWPA